MPGKRIVLRVTARALLVAMIAIAANCGEMDEFDTGEAAYAATGVSWTNLVGVTTITDGIKKTSANGWNAGASSVEMITAGDGYLEFTTTDGVFAKVAGLGNNDASVSYFDIDYALFLRNGEVRVLEDGYSKTSPVPYAAGDIFRIEVTGGIVTYKQNGTPLYTSSQLPVYPLAADTSIYSTNATVTGVVLSNDAWLGKVNVTTTPTSITKVSGGSGWNAGAYLPTTVTNSGYCEFGTTSTANPKIAGFNNADTGQNYPEIEFAIGLMGGGSVRVYETGINRGTFGTYTTADVFRIQRVGGTVTYLKNGVVFYTSTRTASGSYVFDTSIYSVSGSLNRIAVAESFWTNKVGVDGSVNLIKTGANGWNAGASSLGSIAAGDGYVTFTSAETNKPKVAGLSNGDTDQSLGDIDFGIGLMGDGTVRVYEHGVNRGSLSTYVAGDVFGVVVSGVDVLYQKNSVTFYTTTAPTITYPLVVDTSLYSTGATIQAPVLVDN